MKKEKKPEDLRKLGKDELIEIILSHIDEPPKEPASKRSLSFWRARFNR